MKKRIKIRYCYECGYYKGGICMNEELPIGFGPYVVTSPILFPEPDFFCAEAIPITEETKKRLEEKVGEWIPLDPGTKCTLSKAFKCSKCGYEMHNLSLMGLAGFGRCPQCDRAMAVDRDTT